MDESGESLEIDENLAQQIVEVFPIESSFSFLYGCVASQKEGQDVANYVRLLAWVLQQRELRISYSGLKRIVFSGDYYQALDDLGTEFNRIFTTTREPNAIGMAITNNVPGGCVVTLHGAFAQSLLGQNQEQRRRAEHVVVHELCHVSDESHSARAFVDVWLKPAKPLDSRLLPLALGVWSEYFANRHSSYLAISPAETTGMLTNALITVERDITTALQKYRGDGNLEEMLGVLANKLRFLSQCVGYVAGLLHGLGTSLNEVDGACVTALGASRLAHHWSALLVELDGLNANYESWNNIRVLDGLCAIWRAITADFGFHYRVQTDGNLYVDIPVRSDGY